MALTYNAVKAEAEALKALCNEAATLLARINQVLEHNSDMAFDWSGGTGSYWSTDGDGNMTGYLFARADVSNAITSLDWIRKLLTNQSMTGSQADHIGNLNKIANPLG